MAMAFSRIVVSLATLTLTYSVLPAFADEDFAADDIAHLFAMSKTPECATECRYNTGAMERISSPTGKVGFLITTTNQNFCGSAGCSSMAVIPSGDKFVKLKEGLGITKDEALALILGEADVTRMESGKPSFDCAKATSASARLICSDATLSKADATLGSKFKSLIDGAAHSTRSHLVADELAWIRSRNVKCGVGPDKANLPIEQLKAARPCMLQAMETRTAELTRPDTAAQSTLITSAEAQLNNVCGQEFRVQHKIDGSNVIDWPTFLRQCRTRHGAHSPQPAPLQVSGPLFQGKVVECYDGNSGEYEVTVDANELQVLTDNQKTFELLEEIKKQNNRKCSNQPGYCANGNFRIRIYQSGGGEVFDAMYRPPNMTPQGCGSQPRSWLVDANLILQAFQQQQQQQQREAQQRLEVERQQRSAAAVKDEIARGVGDPVVGVWQSSVLMAMGSAIPSFFEIKESS